MALRDGYILPLSDAIADGYILPAADVLADDYANLIFGGGERPLSLAHPLNYQGRVGIPVPSGAEPLPRPHGGKTPYTVSLSLPAGIQQANGVLSGTPTAAGDNSITYSVTDAAGAMVSRTFDFDILAADAAMNLKDFAHRGYHANEFTGIVYAAVLRSGITIGTSSTSRNIWSSRSGEQTGSAITDPEEDLAYGPNDHFIDRMRWNNGDDWVLNTSNTDEDGNAVSAYNFSTWDDNEGQGKKAYIGKRDGTFIEFDVGGTTQDGRWVAGTVWCRWEFNNDGSTRKNFIQAISANDYFAFMIAD